MFPECPHNSVRTLQNPSTSTEEEPRPSADSSCSSSKEVTPQSPTITVDSEDSRPAEHPSTSDATAAAIGSVGQLNDIGVIIKLGVSVDEAARAINALSNGEKYKLVADHYHQARLSFPLSAQQQL